MESLEASSCFVDNLLDFDSDICEDDDDEDLKKLTKPFSSSLAPLLPLPEFGEEELEWISNKDAFPSVETFMDMSILPKHHSPVSVLDTTTVSSGGGSMMLTNSLRVPVKARSKCLKKRREIPVQQCWWSQENLKVRRAIAGSTIGRKCQHCGSEKTPQWRAGPSGPKTLCNACGVRFKSGRLVPEYRPASSPSFRNDLHSNSHRKVVEMRRQKQLQGLVVVKPMEKG